MNLTNYFLFIYGIGESTFVHFSKETYFYTFKDNRDIKCSTKNNDIKCEIKSVAVCKIN